MGGGFCALQIRSQHWWPVVNQNSEDGLAQLKGELGEQLMLNGIDPVNLF